MSLQLDPLIHQPTRLQIMALLFRNRRAAATWVRDTLGLTDGNLGSHAERLAEAGYVQSARALTPGGFQVQLAITEAGDRAFRAYLVSLRRLVLEEAGGAGDGRAPPAGSRQGEQP